MHGKIEITIDGDDLVKESELIAIDGIALGHREFSGVWRIIWTAETAKEMVAKIEQIAELLKAKIL